MSNYDTPLFPPQLIPSDVQQALPENLVLRPLTLNDYDRGFFECLSQLTKAAKIPQLKFTDLFHSMKTSESYYTLVIEDTTSNQIVGAGTLLLEQKFIRSGGLCGHIEDIVVHDSQRGKKLGLRIIDSLKGIGKQLNCYKITLNCSESNVKFYEKCGLTLKDFQMVLYNDQEPSKVNGTSQRSQL